MDFDVTDFNVRLRTIKIREVVIACIVAFILTIVVAIIFPEIGENEDLIMMPLYISDKHIVCIHCSGLYFKL